MFSADSTKVGSVVNNMHTTIEVVSIVIAIMLAHLAESMAVPPNMEPHGAVLGNCCLCTNYSVMKQFSNVLSGTRRLLLCSASWLHSAFSSEENSSSHNNSRDHDHSGSC